MIVTEEIGKDKVIVTYENEHCEVVAKLYLVDDDLHPDSWISPRSTKNNTEVFGEGYIAGYNQALVDKGFMTQEEADKILQKGEKTVREENCCDCKYDELDIEQEPCWSCTVYSKDSKWEPHSSNQKANKLCCNGEYELENAKIGDDSPPHNQKVIK